MLKLYLTAAIPLSQLITMVLNLSLLKHFSAQEVFQLCEKMKFARSRIWTVGRIIKILLFKLIQLVATVMYCSLVVKYHEKASHATSSEWLAGVFSVSHNLNLN